MIAYTSNETAPIDEEKRQLQKELEETYRAIIELTNELGSANRKILEQQKSLIEEERLKVLLQMAGATAHELNQPLTALLGNIYLIRMMEDIPKKVAEYLDDIEDSAKRIEDIVSRVQNIRHYETKSYVHNTLIINLNQKVNILSVEDIDNDFETINTILKNEHKIRLTRARNIYEAKQMLEKYQIDLVLLDYLLPDGNGLDFITIMNNKGFEIPIIVITAQGNEMIASQVIQAGAYDYLSKEMISGQSLYRSIANALEKDHLRREIKQTQKKIAKMATKDELTNLYNRWYFMEALESEIVRAKRYESGLGLCMIDLDYFKQINDSYGHLAGDMVLSEIGKMLIKCIRKSDVPCRYGGEEFAIILPNTQVEEATAMCERFRKIVAEHYFEYNSLQFQITVSIGIVLFNIYNEQPATDLVNAADQALYQAKKEGRNRVILK